MSRNPSSTDFVLTVDDIGTFTFAKRSMRDQFRVQAEHARLTEGVSPVPDDLDLAATAVATLKVFTVAAPDGWDVDSLDPLDPESYVKLMAVFGAFRARE